jgi:molybdenum cofactor cytidylyltransferase/nicotine blue oxidoreductase
LSVAAALLAAGHGSRLDSGVAKPLAQLRERPLIAWALDAVMASALRPVLVVVGAAGEEVAAAVPSGVTVVHAEQWAQGIAHSLHAALDALEGHVQVSAVCIGLADQPGIGAAAYERLREAHDEGAQLAVATYHGERGNPVLLGRDLWANARALRGDVGARALMGDHEVIEVDCTSTGDPRDVDTLDDLRALESELGQP